MKKASPALWILVPLSLILATSSLWATFHFGPTGSKAYATKQCDSLRTFVLDEENAGKADWTIYKGQVNEYLGLNPEVNRTEIVDSMSKSEWNTDFYADYLSANQFLKRSQEKSA